MTVGDLQKYLRSLADALAAAKAPSKDLLDTAEHLSPFAQHSMASFAEFLKIAEGYRATGQIPDVGQKAKKPAANKLSSPEKSAKANAAEVVALVNSLQSRAMVDGSINRQMVEQEVGAFEKKLTMEQWKEAAKLSGYSKLPATKPKAIELLVNHALARRSGSDRADA